MCRVKIVLTIIIIMAAGVLTPSASGVFPDFDNNLIVDINDLAIFTDYWLLYTTEPEDLDGSGFVDLRDFSSFAAEWMTNCCDDNSLPVDATQIENWQWITLTGIGGCDQTECWWNPGWSDPCVDRCDKYVYQTCQETAEFGSYCAYNYWYIAQRVGLCVYYCGRNAFGILKNRSGCRILATIHIVRDIPPQDPECYPWGCDDCDEQDIGYYNWQLVITMFTDPNRIQQVGLCKYHSRFINIDDDIYFGNSTTCKIMWWPH
jgi:hypothetical protein